MMPQVAIGVNRKQPDVAIRNSGDAENTRNRLSAWLNDFRLGHWK
jgi:hypothetical protein